MTVGNPVYIAELLITFLGQLRRSVKFPLLELISTRGKGGKPSPKVLPDTLMLWYDTLPKKQKEKYWTMTADFHMQLTRLGVRLPV
jgi:hypothetical protein